MFDHWEWTCRIHCCDLCCKADLKPVVYTGMEPGGQLTTTTEVDNFGYPKGVDGPSMMVELQQQAERFGTEVCIGHVTKSI